MAKTVAQLIERALHIVGQVGVGQDVPAEDFEFTRETFESLNAELGRRGILAIGYDDVQEDAVQDEFYDALSNILAADISPRFKDARIGDVEREALINRIRRLAYVKGTGETLKGEYF